MAQSKHEVNSLPRATDREWLAQRISWILWAAIIVAALCGLLGPGPLSTTLTRSSDGTAEVLFNKYLHYHSSETLEVLLRPERDSETAELFVSRSLLDKIQICRMEPEPVSSLLIEDGVTYSFAKEASANLVKIVMHVEYQNFGEASGQIGLAEHSTAQLNQFVYP